MTCIDDIVLALEDRRIASMISGDAEALATLISPACRYVHSSGDSDTGRAYLDKVRSGVFGYEAADIDERSDVVSAANVATIVFRMRATVRVGTVRRQTFDRCTAVWADRDTAFQLVAFQATPLVPSQALPGALSREC
ncbi:MAG TPA: nuclear transport factor 2 family protein, partial [Mycobacterium sp.]